MEYRINPQEIRKTKQRYTIYYCCLWIFIILSSSINGDFPHIDISTPGDLIVNIIVDIIALSGIAFGLFRVIQYVNDKWKRYRLVITDANIIRENYGLSIIQINIAEIISVRHFDNGDLAIVTNKKTLLIPPVIEDMDGIISHFQIIGFTIEENVPVTFFKKNIEKINIAYWFSIFINFLVDNRIFVVAEGIVVILVTVFFLQRILFQKYPIAKKAKNALPFIFVLIILAIHICSKFAAK